MLASLLFAFVTATRDPETIEGACTRDMLPVIDEACGATNKGSFDAAAKNLKSCEDCAQYAKDQCNKNGAVKAVYVTYSGGSFDFNAGTGMCSWFAADQCGCYDEKTCGMPKTLAGADVSGTTTGSIDVLLPDHEGGADQIPVQRSPDDGAELQDTVQDASYAAAQQAQMNKDPEAPEEPGLQLIPPAEELTRNVQGWGAKDPMSLQLDTAEMEPTCPPEQVAVMREEWQCIALEHGGLQTGRLMGFIMGCWIVGGAVAGYAHTQGKKLRGKAGGDEDAGDDAASSQSGA